MASTNPVPKLYMSVIEDVISEVHGLFLNDGVDEQVLKELKTLWENKLMQSKAVEGFHTEMQAAAMQAAQQQHQQQHIHHLQQAQQYAQPAQAQAAPPVMGFWAYRGTPYQPLINQGQLMQVVRGPNGPMYIIPQPQQQVMLQQQMHPGGAHSAQAPGMQHVLAPLRQPQPIIFANRAGIQGSNAQEMPGHAAAQVQPTQQGQSATAPQAPRQPQALQQQQPMQPQQPLQPHQLQQPQQPQQPQQQSPPVFLQLDGAGNNTSSDEDDEEEDYDEDEDDEEEGKDKGEEDKGGQHGQAEEEAPLNSEDDLSDEGPDQFDTEYVVVCQYDKIHRTKNKWKFQLKDGIMNLNGRDYVFSKANGDAEW